MVFGLQKKPQSKLASGIGAARILRIQPADVSRKYHKMLPAGI